MTTPDLLALAIDALSLSIDQLELWVAHPPCKEFVAPADHEAIERNKEVIAALECAKVAQPAIEQQDDDAPSISQNEFKSLARGLEESAKRFGLILMTNPDGRLFLKGAQPDPLGVQPCCGEYEDCGRPCMPRGRYIAQQQYHRDLEALSERLQAAQPDYGFDRTASHNTGEYQDIAQPVVPQSVYCKTCYLYVDGPCNSVDCSIPDDPAPLVVEPMVTPYVTQAQFDKTFPVEPQGEPVIEFDREDEETLKVLVNGNEVFTCNHDSLGWEGMGAVQESIEAVMAAIQGTK
jgi:hypothetical protein